MAVLPHFAQVHAFPALERADANDGRVGYICCFKQRHIQPLQRVQVEILASIACVGSHVKDRGRVMTLGGWDRMLTTDCATKTVAADKRMVWQRMLRHTMPRADTAK